MRHREFGLLCWDQRRATAGVTLFSPLNGKATYIIGMRGEVLHAWQHPLVTGTYGYLLDNGNLLWSGRLPEGPQHMGGRGGLTQWFFQRSIATMSRPKRSGGRSGSTLLIR